MEISNRKASTEPSMLTNNLYACVIIKNYTSRDVERYQPFSLCLSFVIQRCYASLKLLFQAVDPDCIFKRLWPSLSSSEKLEEISIPQGAL
jgi:hypothetical protein